MKKLILPSLAGLAMIAATTTPTFADSSNQPWYKAWGPNTTGVPTPGINCAEYDPDMRPYLGDRANEIPEGFAPFACSRFAPWPSSSIYLYDGGWWKGSGNYWH